MADDGPRFHVELRAFPHVARVFNLDREQLHARFVAPWASGRMIEHDDRRWPADRTRLVVWCGPAVDAASRGLGRGWGEVTRGGEDVTEAVVAEARRGAEGRPEVESLKDVLAETAAGGGLRFPDAVALAAAAHPGWRAAEHLALAEQAVWEMLHRDALELLDADLQPIGRERWQEMMLSWETWTGTSPQAPRLHAPVPGEAG